MVIERLGTIELRQGQQMDLTYVTTVPYCALEDVSIKL